MDANEIRRRLAWLMRVWGLSSPLAVCYIEIWIQAGGEPRDVEIYPQALATEYGQNESTCRKQLAKLVSVGLLEAGPKLPQGARQYYVRDCFTTGEQPAVVTDGEQDQRKLFEVGPEAPPVLPPEGHDDGPDGGTFAAAERVAVRLADHRRESFPEKIPENTPSREKIPENFPESFPAAIVNNSDEDKTQMALQYVISRRRAELGIRENPENFPTAHNVLTSTSKKYIHKSKTLTLTSREGPPGERPSQVPHSGAGEPPQAPLTAAAAVEATLDRQQSEAARRDREADELRLAVQAVCQDPDLEPGGRAAWILSAALEAVRGGQLKRHEVEKILANCRGKQRPGGYFTHVIQIELARVGVVLPTASRRRRRSAT